MDVKKLIEVIQLNLTPDLLKESHLEENKSNPLFGHCYVASESLYYLIRKFKLYSWFGFAPHYARDDRNITHWWLQDKVGNILDPTKEQYFSIGKSPPYIKGKGKFFIPITPSNRSKLLIERVLNYLEEEVPPPKVPPPQSFFTL